MNARFLLLLLALTCSAQATSLTQAQELVRQGRSPEALKLLTAAPQSPEALFWKGRALLDVGRWGEAARALSQVPVEHPLHPYAARGLLYCAWQGENLNFIETVAPLTVSPNQEVADLALAALAEYQLKNTQNGDLSSLEELRKRAGQYPEYQPLLRLLELEALRRKGEFEQALSYGRKLEADKSLPLLMRQRVRLALSEVYYAREAELANQPLVSEDDTDDDGKGEETLLQFISANPDSPLLEEAFRRLALHQAFHTSEYAKDKLREWAADSANPRRATLALLALQQLCFTNTDPGDDSTCANTAASSFPKEEATRQLLQEQARHLLSQGRERDALLYLDMLRDKDDARSLFYEAEAHQAAPETAEKLFLLCADQAPAALRSSALANALICAMKAGHSEKAEALLRLELLPSTRRELLLAHAGLLLHLDPEKAREELREALELNPTESLRADALLDLAELEAKHNPEEAQRILAACPPEQRKAWSDAQELRYHALQVAVQREPGHEAESSLAPLRLAIQTSPRPAVKKTLTEHLAAALSDCGQHSEALQLLEELMEETSSGEEKARLMIRTGREAERLGSREALDEAVSLYSACERTDTPHARRATLLKAALLSRLNREEEARGLLLNMLKHKDTLPLQDLALAYSILSDSWSMEGSDEGKQQALDFCDQIFQLSGLPKAWYTRATLQRACLHARFGHHSEALEDYLNLLRQRPAAGDKPDKSEWFILYYSAAGAIYQHVQLKQYAEAAQLAETIANWPDTQKDQPDARPTGPRSQLFEDWAARIRKTHFLPASSQGTSLFPAQRNSHQTAR